MMHFVFSEFFQEFEKVSEPRYHNGETPHRQTVTILLYACVIRTGQP